MYLHPESKRLFVWNLVVAVSAMWFAFSVPIALVMPAEDVEWFWNIDVLAGVIFLVDIFLGFFTAFTQDGELITEPSALRKHYLKKFFIADSAAALPVAMFILTVGHLKAWAWMRLVSLVKQPKVQTNLNHYGESNTILRLVQMTVMILFFTNLIACGWLLIPHERGPNFDALANMANDSWTRYVWALYYTVVTIATVGYGDISGHTVAERLYTSGMIFFGVGLFGFIVGNISSLLVNANIYKVRRREKMNRLGLFFEHYTVPEKERQNVYEFYQHELSVSSLDDEDLIKELPLPLQSQMRRRISLHILSRVPMLAVGGEECMARIGEKLQKQVFAPGENIIEAGQEGHEMYIILHGAVEILTSAGVRIVKLRSGAFFGEKALLVSERRSATVRSLSYCDLYKLEKKDFLDILREFPDFRKGVAAEVALRYPGQKIDIE